MFYGRTKTHGLSAAKVEAQPIDQPSRRRRSSDHGPPIEYRMLCGSSPRIFKDYEPEQRSQLLGIVNSVQAMPRLATDNFSHQQTLQQVEGSRGSHVLAGRRRFVSAATFNYGTLIRRRRAITAPCLPISPPSRDDLSLSYTTPPLTSWLCRARRLHAESPPDHVFRLLP